MLTWILYLSVRATHINIRDSNNNNGSNIISWIRNQISMSICHYYEL